MKIAFLGTHGTGKTTLAHDLVVKLKKQGVDAGFLSEIARKCPFPLNEDATKKTQIWIILNQIIAEMEAEDRCGTLVCDRSVMDGYCYYVNKFGRSSVLEALVREHLKTYSKLIRVPIREGLLRKDKVRSVNEKFQKDVDRQFDRFVKLFGLEDSVQMIKKEKLSDEEIIDKVLNTI
ncbi:AAA family ATPase [Candidatus Pacearchaeota archaeon]|nr:AAA family ATPase [Candidatus Pacearchaeota archaeon]